MNKKPVHAKLHGHRVSTDSARKIASATLSLEVALYWERGVYFMVYEDAVGATRIERVEEEDAKILLRRLLER